MDKFEKKAFKYMVINIIVYTAIVVSLASFVVYGCDQISGEVKKTGLKNIVTEIWEGKN